MNTKQYPIRNIPTSVAKENNYRLVTFDKDFEVLVDIFGKSLLIL